MTDRPLLRVLDHSAPQADPEIGFCGYCGRSPLPSDSRVCVTCGLGVVLTAGISVAPNRGDAFLVVDQTLEVCAVSRGAERLLAISEPRAVNRPVGELIAPADVEVAGLQSLVSMVISAGSGESAVQSAVVRPAGEFGIRYLARIAPCGPPRAALLILTDEDA